MSELRDVLEKLIALLLGALLAYLQNLIGERRRRHQGMRVGSLEDRVAYVEGLLGIKHGSTELASDTPTPRERPATRG